MERWGEDGPFLRIKSWRTKRSMKGDGRGGRPGIGERTPAEK